MTDKEVRERAVLCAQAAYEEKLRERFPQARVDRFQFAAAVLSTVGESERDRCVEFAAALASDKT